MATDRAMYLGGLFIRLPVPTKEVIKGWADRSGMRRQDFLRAALILGCRQLAVDLGLFSGQGYPVGLYEDLASVVDELGVGSDVGA